MKRVTLKYCFLAAVMATMIAIPGAGIAGKGPAGDFIEHFDSDGDGQVSADEFPGNADHFKAMDADGDGYISAAEAPQGPPPGGPGRRGGFENDDVDQDGRVSAEEFNGPDGMFERLDADGDGYITKAEAEANRPKRKE